MPSSRNFTFADPHPYQAAIPAMDPEIEHFADFGYSRKWRYFRRLAAQDPVSGEDFWRIPAEGREFCGESLLDDFSIFEI